METRLALLPEHLYFYLEQRIDMEDRPSLKIQPDSLDKVVDAASTGSLIILWGLTIYAYWKLPSVIAIHFNAAGQADGQGSKNMILILPILGTIIYIGFSRLVRYPGLFNYPTEITASNAKREYSIATKLLRLLKLFILFIFSFLTLFIYLTTMKIAHGLGKWSLPIAIVFLLIPVVIGIVKMWKSARRPDENGPT